MNVRKLLLIGALAASSVLTACSGAPTGPDTAETCNGALGSGGGKACP